jgi:tRNA pseudouridine38-40 synthase
MVLSYDGTNFHGMAPQLHVRTVADALTAAIERMTQHPVDLVIAGRTDSGVHAWGQVVSFSVEERVDVSRIKIAVNGQLAPEIVVRDCRVVDPGFDARFTALSRTYRYTIVNRPQPDPFRARFAWWIPERLSMSVLRLAADPFVGLHDFASFCRTRHRPHKTTTRRVFSSQWIDEGDGIIRYDVTATAFCWQQVRSIVGTQIDAALGKLQPGDMMTILRARDRAVAGQVAPPHGLCLWDVTYPDGGVNDLIAPELP